RRASCQGRPAWSSSRWPSSRSTSANEVAAAGVAPRLRHVEGADPVALRVRGTHGVLPAAVPSMPTRQAEAVTPEYIRLLEAVAKLGIGWRNTQDYRVRQCGRAIRD